MLELEIFKTISIGGMTKEQLIKQLIEAGIQFNEYAKILFDHPNFSPTDHNEKVSFVKLKLSDLSMDNPCSFQELVNRASNLGLRLCPLYCAAFLRLEYLEQPEGSYLTVASDRPESDENYPNGFYVRHFNKTLWLRGYRAADFCEWPLDNEFLFLK